MKSISSLIVILLLPTLVFGQTQLLVRPNTADPLSGEPNNFHFVYINQHVASKNKLFLFFPGTGAVPFNYREILKHAANLGYHSIGLTYPNSIAINQLCLTTVDTTCHSRARLEVFDGIDRHADMSVDTNNCIERRTLMLLKYLDSTYPGDNWGQYFGGDEILWENIIVSGHSQGGGHAGMIAKIKQVERVVMFAAMDWIPLLNRNADWITWNGETPAHKYYGFTHQNDEAVAFDKIKMTWENYGMNNYGEVVLVDTANTPFGNSRTLYTLHIPANDTTKFHGSVVADIYTPLKDNVPVFAPVWAYMIEGNEALSSVNDKSGVLSLPDISLFPNPTNSILYVSCLQCDGLKYKIYDVGGKIVQVGNVEQAHINLVHLQNGFYFVHIYQGDGYKVVKIIKQ